LSRSNPQQPAADQAKLLLLAAGVGLLGGGAAVLFRALAVLLPSLLWPADPNIVHAVEKSSYPWRIAVPVAGALLAGWVLAAGSRWAGTMRGWDILEAVVLRDGILHARSAIVKATSSLFTIASGGSVGREGPMVLLSSTVASWGARRLGTPVRQRRILVAAGAAAGIAAAYNVPVGAALFTMEIIVGSFALEAFAPLVFASVLATLVSRAAFADWPVFKVQPFQMISVWEVALYVLLGALCGLVAVLFLRALRRAGVLFRASGLPQVAAMALVALVFGAALMRWPELAGNGREGILDLFSENWIPRYLLALFVLRLVFTALTVGAGAVGGVFTPTLFLGALLGDAFGGTAHWLFPGWTAEPKAYALVGMGCLLAGITHAPMTAVLMLFEMTLDYNLVVPLLVGAAAASLVARGIEGESIYTEALRRKRGTSPMAGGAAVMRSLTVSDVMRTEQATASGDEPLPELLDRFLRERRNHIYIVDDEARFLGVVSLYEASRALREAADPGTLRARDVADRHFPTVNPEDRLEKALDRFWVQDCERLPVLESPGSRRLVGTVSKRDILGVYSLEVLHRRSLLARLEATEEDQTKPTYVELPEDHEVAEVEVPAHLIGLTFGDARLRERFGVSVLVLSRREGGRTVRLLPQAETRLFAGDRLYVFGTREALRRFKREDSRI
jgi:CIC family chloride channel protein